MAENKPTDEELAYLRARRLIDAGLALASATFQVAFTYTYIHVYIYIYILIPLLNTFDGEIT